MKSQPPKDPNQGEGDRISARHYNKRVREFVEHGNVDEAAREAAEYVETEPDDAKRAERIAKRGPHPTRVSVDELVAKGRSVFDRVRPYVQRIVSQVRQRIARGTR